MSLSNSLFFQLPISLSIYCHNSVKKKNWEPLGDEINANLMIYQISKLKYQPQNSISVELYFCINPPSSLIVLMKSSQCFYQKPECVNDGFVVG